MNAGRAMPALMAMLIAWPVLTSQASDGAVVKPCKDHPDLVGPCFTVRGRMNFWNGSPSVRIWKVGTKRILGVRDQGKGGPGYSMLPDAVLAQLSWDTDLFADFTVCPLGADVPGAMQIVCVDSATHVVVRTRAKQ